MSKKSSQERDGHPRRERRDTPAPASDAAPPAGDAAPAAGGDAVPPVGEDDERFATAAELSERLAALEADLAEAHREAADARQREERLLRSLAERENQLRRIERHRERDTEQFRGELVISLLAVLDDFERALESGPDPEEDAFAAGVALVAEGLRGALAQLGLAPIEALGETFDPALHEAVMQLPNTDAPKGQVIQEMQKGYRLGDRVLRPSRVAVAG